MLRIDHVTFAHPGQEAAYQFYLSVAPGEIVAITGVSGSGKSTMLDLIAGFLKPSSGAIRFGESELTGLPPEHRPVSILFQADNLFDHLTVNANLALGLPKTMPRVEQETRMDEALANVDLAGYGTRRAANLSGGQKQRVALARTLLRDKPILLLDEPFSALDPETAQSMRQLILRLTKERSWCVIIVSHDEEDIEALATHHFHIDGGKLNRA